MPALPPPPPSSPPPGPAPKPPAPPPADPPPLMPYDDLFGEGDGTPEAPPNLTFNVAAAPLPPPPRPAGPPSAAKPPIDVPGIVVTDDRPAWVPPRAADEPPDPLLKSPVQPAPAPQAFVPPPPPVPKSPRSISELMDKVGKPPPAEEDFHSTQPQMWSASDALAGKAAPVPRPPPAAARPPAAPLPQPPQQPARAPSFDKIAPAPVRTPPPSAADHRASRPVPLTALTPDDEDDYARAFASDDDDEDVMTPGGRRSASPEADTVIAVAAPMRRAYGSQPSLRLLGVLMTVLLALWIARLGASPLLDVDEGAFAEATRELTI